MKRPYLVGFKSSRKAVVIEFEPQQAEYLTTSYPGERTDVAFCFPLDKEGIKAVRDRGYKLPPKKDLVG